MPAGWSCMTVLAGARRWVAQLPTLDRPAGLREPRPPLAHAYRHTKTKRAVKCPSLPARLLSSRLQAYLLSVYRASDGEGTHNCPGRARIAGYNLGSQDRHASP
ncbi:hypothetical protein VTO73DRAFT_15369 [Trametes versicolor]